MLYDIGLKRLFQISPSAFWSLILREPLPPSTILEELSPEMPTLNRADHVWKIMMPDETYIGLIEFLSHWTERKKLTLVLYNTWLKQHYELHAKTFVVLCLPNANVTDTYQDANTFHKFEVLKLYELNAQEFLDSQQLGLYPLLPFMKGGPAVADVAGQALYQSNLSREVKGDLIALLGMFLGLTGPEEAAKLIWNRTDFMNILAESPIYQKILDEGEQKGLKKGLKKGEQRGLQKGLRDAVRLGLELRFGPEGVAAISGLEKVQSIEKLQAAQQALRQGATLAEIQALLA